MSLSFKSVALFGRTRAREGAWFIAGISLAVALSATAQLGGAARPSPVDCGLNDAMRDAVNKKVQLIGMTSPDPGKYFNAGSPDSCLGNMSIADLDLSKLIPDPLGLLTVAVDGVIDKLKQAAIGAACAAVRNSVGDVIGKYNYAIGNMNGLMNVTGQTNQFIDSAIGNASRQVLDGYAMNWTTPKMISATAGVQAQNLPVILPAIQGVTTPSAVANALSSPSRSATTTPAAPAASTPSTPAPAPSGGLGASLFRSE